MRYRPTRLLFPVAAAACLSCSSDGPSEPTPSTGAIRLSIVTEGTDPPDEYVVTIDGAGGRTVEATSTTTLDGLAVGSRSLELSGVPVNCQVEGANPRLVSIQAGREAVVGLTVTCVANVGFAHVHVEESGPDPDPDGYGVIYGDDGRVWAVVSGHSLRPVPPGDTQVELFDAAENCMVLGENPRTINVAFADTVLTTFEVVCSATTGTLELQVSTTGLDQDANGYRPVIDGDVLNRIDANGTHYISGIPAGDHELVLSDVNNNCSVVGGDTRAVAVTAGDTSAVAFDVTCEGIVGVVRVTADTEGSPLDPNGYQVTVNEGASLPLGVNGDTVLVADVPRGDATVRLDDIEPGCYVLGGNPQVVELVGRDTALVAFGLRCDPELAQVTFVTNTEGFDLDPDGYAISLDGAAAQPIGVNDSVTFVDLTLGVHSLLLSGLASNCATVDPNPALPNVTPGGGRLVMDVECTEIPNTLPDVLIVAPDPTPGVVPPTVAPGDPVTFTGSADDPEDGPLTGASLAWTSNVDGSIGTGASFSTSSLSEGLHTITLTAFDSAADSATATALLLVAPPPDPARYDITLRLSPGTTLTPGQRAAIEAAVDKLEAVVIGDIADVPFSFGTGSCGADFPPMNEVVDDLVLFLSVEPIDGPGGILGAAGPCFLRGNSLPMLGGMRFDSADLLNIESFDLVDELLLHEAMHVMGFGTVWSALGFLELPSNPARGGIPGNDTYFDGPAALTQFDAIGGATYTGGNVVPVENNNASYGSGSLDSHWRESVFDTEVMTPSLDVGVVPLSVLTVGQFEDLGYVVDPGAADPYNPVFQLRAPGGRGEFPLVDDVLDAPVWIVGPTGALISRLR